MLPWAGASTGLPGSGESTMQEGMEILPWRASPEHCSQKAEHQIIEGLANSLEHWGLAGTHPSLHERSSVFYSSKQLMG